MKDLLITHVADIDGLSPVILFKLTQRNFDYKLLQIQEIDLYFEELFSKDLSEYENIYITDLTLTEAVYNKIEQNTYKNRFKVFDHHRTHLFALFYPYATIDINECGTSLFYNYLKNLYPIEKDNVSAYVDHVKNLDIWLWVKKEDFIARDLGDLCSIYGEELYIETMYERLSTTQPFHFSTLENKMLQLHTKKKQKYMERKEKEMYKIQWLTYTVGVVFSEQYRSEMGDVLSNNHPDLDLIAMVNTGGGVSFRTSKEDVDLSILSEKMGGGGHKKAAGFGFPESLRRELIQKLFEGCEIIDESK